MVEGDSLAEVHIRLHESRCMGCFECVEICPQSGSTAFPVYERGEAGLPRIANPESCIRCLSCESICRAVAIRIETGAEGKGSGIEGARARSKCNSMF